MTFNSKLTPLALAVAGLGYAAPSLAGEPIEFDNGAKLEWRLTGTYSMAQRVKGASPVLAANAGGNDGDNNFAKNSLVANRLALLLETTLSKGDSGFILSASSFYDDVYRRKNDNNAKGALVNKPGATDEFSNEARYMQGGYSRILDAYAYTGFTLGEQAKANVRLGKHVVSWGESLFFPGISLAQGPADGTKTGVPGTETKDQLLPEDQISAQIEVTPNWSLLAHYQYNWHETLALAPGAYLSSSDGVGPGGNCLGPYVGVPAIAAIPAFGLPAYAGFSGCSFGRRINDIRPKKAGQWGVGTRYRWSDETEFGLYYLNYKDRTPLPEINAFAAGSPVPAAWQTTLGATQFGNGTYQIHYFDDIKLVGGSFATTFGIATLTGELSFKQGAPVLVNTVVDPVKGTTMPTPTRSDIMQANLASMVHIGRTPMWDDATLALELAYVEISKIKARKAPGVESLGPAAAFFPATDRATFGTNGLAFGSSLTLNYPGIIENWQLDVPLSYLAQIRGRTLLGGVGGEGDQRYSVGATMTYRRNFSVGVSYLGYLGNPEVVQQKTFRPLTDRNQVSLVMKYAF